MRSSQPSRRTRRSATSCDGARPRIAAPRQGRLTRRQSARSPSQTPEVQFPPSVTTYPLAAWLQEVGTKSSPGLIVAPLNRPGPSYHASIIAPRELPPSRAGPRARIKPKSLRRGRRRRSRPRPPATDAADAGFAARVAPQRARESASSIVAVADLRYAFLSDGRRTGHDARAGVD